MKKIFGFLSAAALLAMGSCANDKFDGPNGPSQGDGDLHMTLNISMKSNAGTRTDTPNQGYEIGQDYENTISSALVIFARNDAGTYKIVTTSDQIISGDLQAGGASTPTTGGENHTSSTHNGSYTATFKFVRQDLLDDMEQNGDDNLSAGGSVPSGATKKIDYNIFVIANPTYEIIQAAQPTANVQQILTLAANNDQYWRKNEFLMTNADVANLTIYDTDIALGKHTEKSDPLNLGTVTVQRAMSRFDLELSANHVKFVETPSESEGPSDLKGITIELDAVAMVNMAQTANLFKVMGVDKTGYTEGTTIAFEDERSTTYKDHWVLSPNQRAYHNPLFTLTSTLPADDPSAEKAYVGTTKDLEKFFEGDADFQLISSLNSVSDGDFEHPGHQFNSGIQGNYFIWRYCMENTNPDKVKNQKNANTTAVIYRAKMSGTGIPTTANNAKNIYAYNNVIIGNAQRLKEYATSPKGTNDGGVYEAVKNIYTRSVEAAIEANKAEGWSNDDMKWEDNDGFKVDEKGEVIYPTDNEKLNKLDPYLVSEGFAIFNPTVSDDTVNYYCYYIYWNRHNDNGLNTIMGTMEFATVRNNVYKLAVNAIHRLGHPGQPGNDPDDPKPDDPDEKDEFWLTVSCEILPWEVRVNNIEF